MGADVGDIGLTVHAHPTLSESVGLAAELADGTSPTSRIPAPLPSARRGARR
jgi:dihydrolipoamide dehydrogenase